MEQYIPKSTLIAEIERLIKKNELYLDENASDTVRFQKTGAYSVLCDLRHFIDTLEVKEVDDEPECGIFPRPIGCYSTCKECPFVATNNKAQKG